MLRAKRTFVMLAQAGIQVCCGEAQKYRLDRGLRGNDGKEKVVFESTSTKALGFAPRSV